MPKLAAVKSKYCGRSFDINYIVLLTVLGVFAFLLISHTGGQVASDGFNYFSYLRSAVFDRDLDFHNEFARFNSFFWETYRPKDTVTGYFTNVFSVGPAILWAPFYLIGHLVVLAANFLGAGYKADGFGPPYLLAINLGSLSYSFIGICLVYRLCLSYFRPWPSIVAALTVWLGTFITFYSFSEPFMSHAVSFFAVTLFVYYWHRTRQSRDLRRWVLLGLTAGLMMLVRWQNGLVLLFPAVESLVIYWGLLSTKDWPGIRRLLIGNTIFLLAAAAAFLPQMAVWKVIYGSFLTVPQGTAFLRWNAPFFSEVLFASRHGLFSWSPVVYLSTIGWCLLFKRDKLMAVNGLMVFLLMTYLNSIVSDWWAGWGFGMRRYDGLIILFALGLGALLDRIWSVSARKAFIIGVAVCLFFSGYNFFLMEKYSSGKLSPGGPVAFDKVWGLADNSFYRYTGNPFSFPANVLFSMRYFVPPASYDTLVGGYVDDPEFYGNTIRFDEEAKLVGYGWDAPGTIERTRCRVLSKPRAFVFAPVQTVTDFNMRVSSYCAETGSISVKLNGHDLANVKLHSGWQEFNLTLTKSQLNYGLNRLEFVQSAGPGTIAVEYLKFTRLEPVTDWK